MLLRPEGDLKKCYGPIELVTLYSSLDLGIYLPVVWIVCVNEERFNEIIIPTYIE